MTKHKADDASSGEKVRRIEIKDPEKVAILQRNSFFSDFPPTVVKEAAALGVAHAVQQGGVLYHAGDKRDKFYIIHEGLVRLTQHIYHHDSATTSFTTLGTFTKGDCLGETALYIDDHENHLTEAIAVIDTTCLVFDVGKLQELMKAKGCAIQMQVAAGAIARNRLRRRTATVHGFRKETDSLGTVEIPRGAYYGSQTQRALNVMGASGVKLSHFPSLVKALSVVKKVAAKANMDMGVIKPNVGAAICQACDEIIEGNFHDDFCLDMLQGGAGVSTMQNANEVIANRATEILGGNLGEYTVHPNEHVNMSQSDDAYHTVIRLSIIMSYPNLRKKMGEAVHQLYCKAVEFRDVVKMGRTMMQDAVPIEMGREFLAWARQLESDWNYLNTYGSELHECLLGGTMMGTGLGAASGFSALVLKHLQDETGLPFETPSDLVVAATDLSRVVTFSGGLRGIAIRTSKICNDLRLLSSGPRCGLKEMNLPEMQPGSSIMPGKVNPVIPEAMNQVCQCVVGNDTTIALAAEAGQLNACIFDSVIVFSVLESIQMLSRGFGMLNKHCLKGITAEKDRCRKLVDGSVSKLTAALPSLGYQKCSQVAEEALRNDTSVEEVLRKMQLSCGGCLSDESLLNSKVNGFEKALSLRTHLQDNAGDPVPDVLMDESGSTEVKSSLANRLTAIRQQLSTLDGESLTMVETLLTNDVFQVLTSDEALAVREMLQPMIVESGRFVYKAGDERKYMYCLRQGVVKIQKTGQDKEPEDVEVLSDGATLAEASLMSKGFFDSEVSLSSGRREMTAVAEVTSHVYRIDLDQLAPYLQRKDRADTAARICKQTSVVLYNRLKRHASGATLTRMDADLLGSRRIPINVYWGVQTLRAQDNFHLSGITVQEFPELVKAYAYIKKACAIANRDQGTLTEQQARGITMACDEIISGKLNNQFVTDMIQGGAGTSTNMNANEVIANRANEILGDVKGSNKYLNANDHVNKSQSTNDSYPTSLHLSIVLSAPKLIEKMTLLANTLREKGREFDHVVKMGRTQLQDAVPVTLGQEFFAWSHSIEDEIEVLRRVTAEQQTTNLGGTAVGTSIAADRDFPRLVTRALSDVTKYEMKKPDDLIAASSDTSGMLTFMATLRGVAVKVSKMCNDFRLMSSGPRCGLNEISLPCVQPYTSLIPGKNDPDIPEMVSMCAFRIFGSDAACVMASHAGQLELNYAEPVMIYKILSSIDMLSSAFDSLSRHCVKGIVCNEEHCKKSVHNSVGIVTCLLPFIGYKNCTKAAKIATKQNRILTEVLVTEGMCTKEELDKLLVPEKMVCPVKLAPAGQ